MPVPLYMRIRVFNKNIHGPGSEIATFDVASIPEAYGELMKRPLYAGLPLSSFRFEILPEDPLGELPPVHVFQEEPPVPPAVQPRLRECPFCGADEAQLEQKMNGYFCISCGKYSHAPSE